MTASNVSRFPISEYGRPAAMRFPSTMIFKVPLAYESVAKPEHLFFYE
jgi:hypothetical protein